MCQMYRPSFRPNAVKGTGAREEGESTRRTGQRLNELESLHSVGFVKADDAVHVSFQPGCLRADLKRI